jgi:heat shock protein HtpX
MFKRIGLMLLVNMAVMMTVMTILKLLGVGSYVTRSGLDYSNLMVFCLIWGMVGSFISLFLSKYMAKWMMNLKMINPQTCSAMERQLLHLVQQLSKSAGLRKCPELAVYNNSELNAFATGPSRNNALIAVSSGLLNSLTDDEVEGVLAHEMSHIANGDMVTMTLVQGVVNAFVMFFSKIVAWGVANAMRGDDEDSSPSLWVVWGVEMVCYVVFGIIGSIVVSWVSRKREFRADAGAAKISGAHKICAALKRLKSGPINTEQGEQAFASFKISSSRSTLLKLLSTHPPLDERIKKLGGTV